MAAERKGKMYGQAAQNYDLHFLDHIRELEMIRLDQQRKVRPITGYVVRHNRRHPDSLVRGDASMGKQQPFPAWTLH
jgi:hypothetical protein